MIQTILLILLLTVNVISLVAFGVDKFNSMKRGYRIPESRLLLLSFFGPFGALAGMLFFRHKTRKIKFLIVPIFVTLQALLLVWYFIPTLNIMQFF
jgi:uncharacterized membrane protein YsdA (DUF1294 family)